MHPQKNGPSRRDFVSGVAAAVVAVAGGGVAASQTFAPAAVKASEKTADLKADETIEAQVVVVGSGLGGLSAAMTAMEEGAKKVVLLEKESTYGGGTNWAECNGPGQQASEARARGSALMSLKSSGYIADPMLHYTMALEDKENKDWLFVKHQVQYELRANDGTIIATNSGPTGAVASGAAAGGTPSGAGGSAGGGPEGGAHGGGGAPGGAGGEGGAAGVAPGGAGAPGGGGGAYGGWGPGGGGRGFYAGGNGLSCIKTLIPQAKALGVDLRPNTQALSLIMKDPYTCIGVRAKTKEGKIIDFKAKGVVLATGGMSTNKPLLAKYTSVDLEKVIIDGPASGQDGDGHVMVEATAHGKATHLCVTTAFINVKGFAYASVMGICAGMQPSNLWVNQDAIRVTDESAVGESGCRVIETQGSVFSIIDQAGFDRYAAGGTQTHYSGFADKLAGKPIPGLAAEFEKVKNLPDVFYAQTLDELATKMGIDAATFKATVERYNGFAAAGKDEEWSKKASNLWPISKAPFYGFRLSSGMLNTNGGIRINTKAQVVDARYKPIAGLYAAGIVTSGWEGENYIGGTCQPVALWGGRKAAKQIVANLL